MTYGILTNGALWIGLQRNGDQLGIAMERLRTGDDDATLDRDNDQLNDLLDDRAELSAEMWRREKGRK